MLISVTTKACSNPSPTCCLSTFIPRSAFMSYKNKLIRIYVRRLRRLGALLLPLWPQIANCGCVLVLHQKTKIKRQRVTPKGRSRVSPMKLLEELVEFPTGA